MHLTAEEILIREAYRYARIQYLIMEKTGDFGEAGKEKITENFCRVVLKLPDSAVISPKDLEQFHQKLSADNHQDIASFPLDRLRDEIENPEFVFMGHSVSGGRGYVINEVLQTLGSKKIWFCSYRNRIRHFIVGNGKLIPFREHLVHCFASEDMRSPYLHTGIQTEKIGKNIMVRQCHWDILKQKMNFPGIYDSFSPSGGGDLDQPV